ncbi:M1 family metallopeptidase [Algiphilus sp. W345]|uniref:Aminopeptidase n=1 Tax=Banduia mediterranea TaxID=3075609 RepID=A0ABU2WNS7_9GAMM|nr:M1 family metallopeptidase [Algiphilus sp. W345]MDT0499006.1 M1 family metallopeptidase [Algiphilus sp. W345]
MLRFVVVLTTMLVSFPLHAEAPFSFATTPGQLPKTVVPEHYEFNIAPDLDTLTFRGHESITIRVVEATDRLVLNVLDIEVQRAQLGGPALGGENLMAQARVDAERQTLSLDFDRTLDPGQYELELDYTGVIGAQAQGLYYDRYPAPDGSEKLLLGTQMEPTDARRLLPCWDEPVFRASFEMSVDVPERFSAYSNMPVANTETLDGGLKRVQFGRTPKMPSYLIVLVAGELEALSGERDGIRLSVVATEGKMASAEYALRISGELLHYYNDYFDHAYPLPKLDQLAMPGGFGGAMENWGGIVYNETALLYDPAKDSNDTEQRVFRVVAHEMAHQWFGDLVTMAWWDNLWLNEGYASWMETKASDHFNPDWNVWLHANGDREKAMSQDARVTTHPIQQTVENESQASDAFDDITYLKGQSFIRMLETYLGEDSFRSGIRDYVDRHAYANTTTEDLWTALEAASGKPVRKIASDWTLQPGFPLLTVAARCVDGRRIVSLNQNHYSVDGHADSGRLWNIPVELGTRDGDSEYVLLDQREKNFELASCAGTLVMDPQAVGYFRVRYAPDLLKALTSQLPQVPAPARLKLISDSWALLVNDQLELEQYLPIIDALGDEQQTAVWEELVDNFAKLDEAAEGASVQTALRRAMVARLRPRFGVLGWTVRDSDPVETRKLRAKLIGALAAFGDQAVIDEAQSRFQAFLDRPEALDPSLRRTVVRIAGKHAGSRTYEILLQRARSAMTTEEKNLYVGALAGAESPELAERTLALSLSDEFSPLIALRIPFQVADGHTDLSWTYVTEHADDYLARLATFQRNGFFGHVAAASSDSARADEMEAFVKQRLPAEAYDASHEAAELIRFHARRRELLLPQIQALWGAADPKR